MMLISVLACSPTANQDYFFVEIMADSEKKEDALAAKKAASGVYAYLAVILNDCKSLSETENSINANLDNIKYIVNEILEESKVSYEVSADIKKVQRDSRQLGNIVISKGKFQTLIITLGDGDGETNFSVLYPGLSYIEGEKDIIIKSKIYEIVEENKSKCRK
jgi:stage II sporulation protein R